MPAVSVLSPMFNTEAFIKDCLDSIAAQTWTDFEAIIINDGSTDDSARIAASYASSDARFRLIGQPNKGPSEARNTGLKIARGEYIAFIDSDDCVMPNYLETLVSIAKENEADIACCGIQNIGETDNVQSIQKTERTNSNASKTTVLSAEAAAITALYQDRVPDFSAWNKLFKASLWKDKFFPADKSLAEDLAVIPEILLSANKVATTKPKLYLYRKHASSILATALTIQKATILNIAEDVFEKMAPISKGLKKASRNTLISASFSVLMRSDDSEEFAEFRKRALANIRKYRFATFFDLKIRLRNRIAIMLSYLPRFLFFKFLKKGIS